MFFINVHYSDLEKAEDAAGRKSSGCDDKMILFSFSSNDDLKRAKKNLENIGATVDFFDEKDA